MSNERRRRKQRSRVRRVRVFRLLILISLLAVVALLSTAAGLYVAIAGNLPSLEAQTPYAAAQTTKIFTDGQDPVLLAELHGVENREIVPAEGIADTMRNAVIAVEDERFWEHEGVDVLSIVRALIADLRHGEIVQGGSTITQQFIKNAYISNEQTFNRKFKEAALAYQLENRWSKEKILTEYLNTIYFGQGAYGVQAAAQEYFAVDAIDLTPAQAALLAAIPKSPTRFDPRSDPEAAHDRRNLILNKMFQQGYLTGAEVREAIAAPLELAPSRRDAGTKAPYWVEMVREQLVAKYGSNTVLKGGLRVYTSLDLERQAIAEDVIRQTFDQPGDPAASLVSIDLKTGQVVAMVGGLDFEAQKFNLATQGHRQPGSAFKPFVLAAALEQGRGPASVYDSGPVTVALQGDDWNVRSPDYGPLTLAEGTAQSSNGLYARLMMDVGPPAVVNMARQLGIQTKLEPRPAIALGGLERGVTPLEMAVAYGTLGASGQRLAGSVTFDPDQGRQPITITKVEDADGRLIDQNRLTRTPALDPRFAYAVTDILKGVIDHGTGKAADIGRPAAGKTGTTQQYRDAWFVGYTPDTVTAVWVGYPDAQKEMTDIHGRRVTGGSFPAEIWAGYMKRALEGVEPTDFEKPQGIEWTEAEVCVTTGLLATSWCPETSHGQFLEGMAPTRSCDVHGPGEVQVPDLVGSHVSEAREALGQLRLEAEVEEVDDAGAEAGEVLRQDPGAGATVMQGTAVLLQVASGEAPGVEVPGVVGMPEAEAADVLAAAGFEVATEGRRSSEAKGTVVEQNPASGTSAAPGATVTLILSTGPGSSTTTVTQPDTATVPEVVGLKEQQAIARLEQAGLRANVTTTSNDQPNRKGTVAAQSEPAGSAVAAGTVVSLTVYE